MECLFLNSAMYRVSQKVTSLRLVVILRTQKFTQLFAIHILIYVPILAHLS